MFNIFHQKPRIHCKEGEFKNFICQNIPIINEKYWPTIWCFEARFQSVLASLIRSFVVPPAPYTRYILYFTHIIVLIILIYFFYREIFTLKDGGEVALDWLEPNDHPNNMNDATILFLPGLTGDSKCEYVRATSLAVHKSGFRIAVFNYRRIGGVDLKVIQNILKLWIKIRYIFIHLNLIIIILVEYYNFFILKK